jgi:hypothetical protein
VNKVCVGGGVFVRIIASLLFVVAWAGIAVTMGPDVWLWKQARSWTPGAATFVSVTPAAQSASGIVEVHYRYQARGALLESTRIFLSSRWLPPSATLVELEQRFQTNLASQRPMRLWINPEDPGDVALYRKLHWPSMTPYYLGSGVVQVLALCLWLWGARRARAAPPASATRATGAAEPASAQAARRQDGPAGASARPVPKGTPSIPPRREAPAPVAASGPRLAALKADGQWCVDLRFQAREGMGVESATLDRLDPQGILRWQDALRVNMLAARPACYVRCALPDRGPALEQARSNPLDAWQVTFRVRTPEGLERWSEPLPDDWWR